MKVVIDGSHMAFRSFFAHENLSTSKGIGVGMAYGMIQTLVYLFAKYKWNPLDVIVVWDGKPQWKFDLYPDYKSGRIKKDVPEAMAIPLQLRVVKVISKLIGLDTLCNPDEEADDMIASYCAQNKGEIVIVGNDHDLQQCLSPNVSMLICGQSGEEKFTEQNFIDKYSIFPSEYCCVQSLSGCQTDKVPGLLGIGEKTAVEIVTVNVWPKIFSNCDDLKFPTKRAETAFRKGYPNWKAERDYKLVTLKKNHFIDVIKNSFNENNLREWFLKLEFKHFLLPRNWDRICELFGGRM